ncbi:endoglucanase E-4-like [Macrobrachium rosenbergii]|uniref:endoglucanase E-4-like n=1 Tax=Macrobrachium rosenbergii TaxID=79674 RepID=UPI0034D67F66
MRTVLLVSQALLLLGLIAGAQSQQCTCISITSEGSGTYTATFSAAATTTFTGLTVELKFNNAVNSLEFDSGSTEMVDNYNFKLQSPGWEAEPGWQVEFTITPHFSGSKPIVVGALMNGVDVCGGSDDCPSTGMGPYDYKQALCMSYLFYEAQRSGPLPSDQRVTWRWDSALGDGSDVGHDLTGGYYDAGDHVKFGFPMAFTATFLAWGLIDFYDGQNAAGQLDYGRAAVKWATDYFLKAHTSHFELYGQVGDGYADHAYWGRPEQMTMSRPSFKITSSAPGSDLAGETAAALAAASIVFKDVDSGYSSQCLEAAKDLYDFADQYRQTYDTSIPQAGDFYKSWSGYGDELCWSALWMFRATGDSSYLQKARGHWDEFSLQYGAQGFNWDDKKAGVYALYTMMDSDSLFRDTFSQFLSYLRNDAQYTPGGLIYLDKWGTNRHAANVAFLGLLGAKLGIDTDANRAFGESQINYILGAHSHSFVVGFGNNPPQKPHHRSSSCPDMPATCDQSAFDNPGPNPQILYGAVVGGPDEYDAYTDDRGDYVHNEVACDYNAGFTAALGAMIENH